MKIAAIAIAFVASAAFAQTGTTTAPAAQAPAEKAAAHGKDHKKDAKAHDCKEKNADGTCKEPMKK
ncbi:MAG: hypothetical protein ACK5Y2_09080 [Bdellovibrionales bacterium]